ncbi:MAG: hypothetical protein GY810_13290 [Aureispira sp.]|nr:hypothetical protein [Aureispira sp.]
MKNLSLFLLTVLAFSLWSCGDAEPTNNSESDPNTTEHNETENTDATVDHTTDAPATLSIAQDVKITAEKEPDERGSYWGSPMKAELAEGFSIVTKSADKGTKDWMLEEYTLQKGGEVLYTFPHKEEDMRSALVNATPDAQWYPKVLTKGTQTAIVMARYMGEDAPKAHLVDVIKIEDGKYVDYLEDVAEYNYTDDLTKEAIEALFAKTFE